MVERERIRGRGGSGDAGSPGPAAAPAPIAADALLDVVRELVDELDPPRPGAGTDRADQADRIGRVRGRRLRLDSSLGAELGLDSLARAELVGRLERRFAVDLPDRVLVEAESPRDLLRALEAAPFAPDQVASPAVSGPRPGRLRRLRHRGENRRGRPPRGGDPDRSRRPLRRRDPRAAPRPVARSRDLAKAPSTSSPAALSSSAAGGRRRPSRRWGSSRGSASG